MGRRHSKFTASAGRVADQRRFPARASTSRSPGQAERARLGWLSTVERRSESADLVAQDA